jgi:hypothetical protein
MRAANITINDVPIQFDASSSHSIKLKGMLEADPIRNAWSHPDIWMKAILPVLELHSCLH